MQQRQAYSRQHKTKKLRTYLYRLIALLSPRFSTHNLITRNGNESTLIWIEWGWRHKIAALKLRMTHPTMNLILNGLICSEYSVVCYYAMQLPQSSNPTEVKAKVKAWETSGSRNTYLPTFYAVTYVCKRVVYFWLE